ncbi:MAG: acyl carrier protein [Candidatus Heimdallarchaeaceae archaeon]|nr:hypothetical protein [Candidatus Heimdallarchaeota archaeon]
MYSSIFHRLRKIIVEVANVKRYVVTFNTYFEDELKMNEDDLVELRKRIENEFDISLPKNIFKEFNIVGEIVGLVEAELGR